MPYPDLSALAHQGLASCYVVKRESQALNVKSRAGASWFSQFPVCYYSSSLYLIEALSKEFREGFIIYPIISCQVVDTEELLLEKIKKWKNGMKNEGCE